MKISRQLLIAGFLSGIFMSGSALAMPFCGNNKVHFPPNPYLVGYAPGMMGYAPGYGSYSPYGYGAPVAPAFNQPGVPVPQVQPPEQPGVQSVPSTTN